MYERTCSFAPSLYLGNILVKCICVSMFTKSCDDRKRVTDLTFIAICQTDSDYLMCNALTVLY